MHTVETLSPRLAPMPDPRFDKPATPTGFSAGEPVGPRGDPLQWLLDCVVDGLLQCACAHQAVHPDLLEFIEHRARSRIAAREGLS